MKSKEELRVVSGGLGWPRVASENLLPCRDTLWLTYTWVNLAKCRFTEHVRAL